MKRLLLFIITIILSIPASHAQFGLSIGGGTSKYKLWVGDTKKKRTSMFSYDFGLLYRAHLSKSIDIQPAIEYAPIIVKNEDPLGNGGDIMYYRNRLNYLRFSLPVMFCIPLGEKHTSLDLGIGPYYSILLSAKSTAHTLEDEETRTSFKVGNGDKDDFKPSDLGLTIHLGARFHHVGLYLADNLGYHNTTPTPNQTSKNRSFMMRLIVYL